MNRTKTRFDEVLIIEPEVIYDNRGFFMEVYRKSEFEQLGISTGFVQDNHSFTAAKGTIRGMHFQKNPMAQCKLIRVVRGEILSVVVDIRRGSSTFGRWISVSMSAENKKQLFVPGGFANGYCSLSDETDVCYRVDNYYAPEYDRAFRWDDPAVGIEWPVSDPILSERDRSAPLLAEVDNNFVYEGK